MSTAPAFPLESIFPGLHAMRPDIAAIEGAEYLEHGAPTGGFDLADPKVRARLLDGKGDWCDFEIAPLPPDLAARVAALPADWQDQPATFPEAEAINEAIETRYALAPRFYVSLNERREAWVREGRP